MALKQYVENARDIAETFELYVKKLNETGFSGSSPYLEETVNSNIKYVRSHAKIKKIISDIESIVALESKLQPAVIVERCFEYYAELLLVRSKLQECLDIFLDNQVNPLQQGSQTSTGSTITQEIIFDLQDHLSDLEEIMESFLPESETTRIAESLANAVSSVLQTESHISWKSVEIVSNAYETYVSKGLGQFVVVLFRMIMQNAIDINTDNPEGAKVIRKIIKIMESLKTRVLETKRMQIIESGNKKLNTVQRLVQWNNLVPHEETMPFPELIFMITGTKGQEKDLNKVCKIISTATDKIGFIIMRKVSAKPMEHKIMSLISRDYAQDKDLLQSSNQGVNRKLYERTETIKALQPQKNTGAGKDDITVYDSEHVHSNESLVNYFYIIETIDGINYRILHPWDITPSLSPANIGKFKIPATWVQHIPDIKKTPSLRLGCYAEIINSSIMDRLQDPILELDFLTREERRKADIKWNNVRQNIVRGLRDEYSDKLNSKSNLSSLLASNKFQSSVMHLIVKELEKLTDSGALAGSDEMYYEELALSYVKDLEAIHHRLGRELINTYQSDYKNSRGQVFEDLLMQVLSKLINNKSNIFISMQYKAELLQKTLLAP